MIGTVLSEAVRDADVRDALAGGLAEIDRAFEARLRRARERGELAHGADAAELARLASAVLYFLAIRSRAGEPRAALEATARAAVTVICGSAPPDVTSSSAAKGRGPRRSGR
jgi:hypothetical protein